MNISVLQEKLVEALSDAIKGVDSRPTLPVLSGILLEATSENIVWLTASNLAKTIRVAMPAKVTTPGAAVLPAKTFRDLAGMLSNERVDMHWDETINTMTIRCGTTVSTLKGFDAATYPTMQHAVGDGVVFPGKAFKRLITETVFASAKEDQRPVLNGVCLKVLPKDGALEFAAADGYRLAVSRWKSDTVKALSAAEFIIPADVLRDAAGLIDDTQDVTIIYSHAATLVSIRQQWLHVTSKNIAGRFPDYAAIIPRNRKTQVTASRADLLDQLRAAEVFCRDDAYSGKFKVTAQKDGAILTVSGKSAERGSADSSLDVVLAGDPFDAYFDVRFVLEPLAVLKDAQEMTFSNNGPDTPGVLQPVGRPDYTYVIMPMTR